MQKLCIFGKKSAICESLISRIPNYVAFDRTGFDVTNFTNIDQFDFSNYDTVINFAGHAKGNYKSPIDNNWQNYLDQSLVNFVSHVMIAKKYVSQNINGRYIWFSSILANECRPYQSVYGASKKATEYAFTNWNKEYPSFKFVNLRLGRVKTGHLYNTFEQTKTKDQCDAEYDLSPFLTADYVANEILKVLTCDNSLTMEIKP